MPDPPRRCDPPQRCDVLPDPPQRSDMLPEPLLHCDPPLEQPPACCDPPPVASPESRTCCEKLSLVVPEPAPETPLPEPMKSAPKSEESNGVGDKIKIFEKAAEDAATAGRLSRPGSMRRPRTERLPSDELPPPPEPEERPVAPRIIRPEFRPLASPAEITIRSPSLGAKAPERFPSHGTAFRNVTATARDTEPDSDTDAFKTCKPRGRERTVNAARGASYFTRGSEEIWLVKKKDIEEIEERVLDSFRRSGGGGAGRGRRAYARSESLEATRVEWAGRPLKRQASVACTCGHDKKPRARPADTAPRPRSRSHGDPPDPSGTSAVLDKYETLV